MTQILKKKTMKIYIVLTVVVSVVLIICTIVIVKKLGFIGNAIYSISSQLEEKEHERSDAFKSGFDDGWSAREIEYLRVAPKRE